MPAATTCTPPSLLGAGLFLAQQAAAGLLPGRVRLIFQPAEEAAGGALDVLAAGGIASVGRIFALHCDPRLDAGQLGVRSGAITAACDKIEVRVSGPGGHTARPHLTADLVYALGKILTEVPAALSRRVDPRSSLSLVWGRVSAGTVANAIPDDGVAEGTVRCLDDEAWHTAPDLLKELIDSVASAYGVQAELSYQRYVPPTVNDQASTAMISAAALDVLGAGSVVQTPQSLGGEDFAWYLESIPGALARLGTRVPGSAMSLRPSPADVRRGRACHRRRGPGDGGHGDHRAVGRRRDRRPAAARRDRRLRLSLASASLGQPPGRAAHPAGTAAWSNSHRWTAAGSAAATPTAAACRCSARRPRPSSGWCGCFSPSANWIDLAVQGRDHASAVAAAILLLATGVAYVTAQRPRIIADETGCHGQEPAARSPDRLGRA